MRRLILVAAMLIASLTAAGPAAAITNGTLDGNAHPNVGGLVAPTQYSDGTWLYCSGTLIAPRVFLTAAHCGEDGERSGSRSTQHTSMATGPTPGRSSPTRSMAGRRTTRTTSPSSSSTGQSRASRRHSCQPRAPCRISPRHSGSPRSATAPTRSPTRRAGISTSTTTSGWSRPEPSTRSTRRGSGFR